MPKADPKSVAQPSPLPPVAENPLPQVEAKPVDTSGLDACKLPDDGEFTGGIFYDGDEPYALCVHDADGYGNTHSLKNSAHTWQGTEQQFNAKFRRK